MCNVLLFKCHLARRRQLTHLKKRCSLVPYSRVLRFFGAKPKPLFLSILIAYSQRNTTFAAAKVQIIIHTGNTSHRPNNNI